MSIDSMPVCSDLVEMVPSIEVHVCVCVCLLMMLFGFESYVLYCIPWLTDHSIEPRWYGCVVRIRCGRSAVMWIVFDQYSSKRQWYRRMYM
jgi:hypothetical protein